MQMLLTEIPLDAIDKSPYQMRRHFAPEEIEGLAASIRRYGLLHPLLVRPKGAGRYELISGERRLRALLFLGERKAPALIRKGEGEAVTAEVALTENLQRVDLSPIEVALSYQSLLTHFNLTQEELSLKLGKPRSTLANFLRLLQLPKNIQDALEDQRISLGHAKALLATHGTLQEKLFQSILSHKLSVRRAERGGKRQKAKVFDPNLLDLENKLTHQVGKKVVISSHNHRGTITFHFEDLDGLESLLEHFGLLTHG